MGDDLQARLKSHARAFEGLMSLIPAKDYYGKDEAITSTQWQKRSKQSKEEKRAAKRAKLDPKTHKTAKDVLDENALKRKREDGAEADDSSDIGMDVEKEKPLEGLKSNSGKSKKHKTAKDNMTETAFDRPEKEISTYDAKAKARADKKQKKVEQKKEKLAKKKEKQDSKRLLPKTLDASLQSDKEGEHDQDEESVADTHKEHHDDHGDDLEVDQIQDLDVSGLLDDSQSTTTPSSANSNASTTSVTSAASSLSSIVQSTNGNALSKKQLQQNDEHKAFAFDEKKHEAFRHRLAVKLEAMRAARRADGPDGRPAKNRAELIEARRKKQAERKAAKKASRQLAKEDEERVKAEEQLARIRGGSGSPSIFSMHSTPENETNLSFGRVAWKDGQQLDSNLSGFLPSSKKKGRSDPKTALEAAKNKKARINGLDETKRRDIEEKDAWLNAKRRAQGERVHDDTSLLKKSLKRQEKLKAKSKQEWKDRIMNVEKGKAMKQKKREENLKKRKEEKGNKGTRKVKKSGKKNVRRPGFEGTFKAR